VEGCVAGAETGTTLPADGEDPVHSTSLTSLEIAALEPRSSAAINSGFLLPEPAFDRGIHARRVRPHREAVLLTSAQKKKNEEQKKKEKKQKIHERLGFGKAAIGALRIIPPTGGIPGPVPQYTRTNHRRRPTRHGSRSGCEGCAP